MIPLTASTVTLLIGKSTIDRTVMLISDSTTVTRLSYNKVGLEVANDGVGITAYNSPLNIFIPSGYQVYGICTSTPNISIIHNVSNATNIVRL